MEPSTASLTAHVTKPKGGTRRHSVDEINTRVSSSSSTNGGKPLPHYLRASTSSCHDMCKYGHKHEFEAEPKQHLHRKLVKNLSMGDDKYQKKSLNQKKLSTNLRSSSLKNIEVSDKLKTTRQKETSRLKESGSSEITLSFQAESASRENAIASASLDNDLVQANTINSADGKKKQLLRSKTLPPNAPANKTSKPQKVVEQKNLSAKGESGADGKSDITMKKTTSSLQKASPTVKPKLLKQTSTKSIVVPHKTQVSKQSTLATTKVIDSSAKSSLKTNRKPAAKSEASLTLSESLNTRRNEGGKIIKNRGITKVAETEGSKSSTPSLSSKLADNCKSLSKPKINMTIKSTSTDNQDIPNSVHDNENNEERTLDVIEMELENANVDDLLEELQMGDNFDSDIMIETWVILGNDASNFHMGLQVEDVDVDSIQQEELPEAENVDVDHLQQEPYDDQSSQELTEAEHVNVDNLQQHPNDDQPPLELPILENNSMHSELQEAKNFNVDFLQQKSDEDQSSQESTEPENIDDEDCVRQKPKEDQPSQEPYDDQSSQELTEAEHVNVDNLQQHPNDDQPPLELPILENISMHSEQQDELPEAKNFNVDFLQQKSDEDQSSQESTEPETIDDEDCVRQKPEEDQPSQELPTPENTGMDSLEENLQEGEDVDFDSVIEKLPIAENNNTNPERQESLDNVDLENPQEELWNPKSNNLETDLNSELQIFPTPENGNLDIAKEELRNPESSNWGTDLSSQLQVVLTPENVDFDIPEQELLNLEEDIVDQKHNDKESSPWVSEHEEEMEETDSEYIEESGSESPYQESENSNNNEPVSDYEDSDKDNNNESESEYNKSQDNSNVDSSKVTERRPRRTANLHPYDSSSAPLKLKFRRGRVIELQPENSSPKKLRFQRARVLDEKGNASKVGRKSYRKKKTDDASPTARNPEAKTVVLRHQDVQEKKDTTGLFNNVIKETASKLEESRKSKVKALVGAFETVISLQDGKPASTS